mmetsp:Transcript_28430/g.71545  ORF Transcript_28430/g.71545 Transcript_28430/m.71545 type:complete len:692 (-) Transcript_28430:62-2137(-)
MASQCLELCEDVPACLMECTAEIEPLSAGALAGSLIGTFFLLCGSACFSGLTLGLLSLDMPNLELIEACGEPDDRQYAKTIMPLRARGNLLLCTLLLGNTIVNSFIAISTAGLTAGITGTILSTAFILILGEIIPQAICSRYALYIGARSVNFVKFFMFLFYPISFPISKMLDYALGRELRTIYNRKELDKLLCLAIEDPEGDLRPEEKHLMSSALAFSEKRSAMIMTRLDHTFCIEVGSKLSFETLLRCYKSGYTRIPVYCKDPSCVVGLLFTKDLILVDPDDEIPVGALLSFCGRSLHVVRNDTTIDQLLTAAQTQRSHLFFVSDAPGAPAGVHKQMPPLNNVIGIVTLEDVLEELIAAEIVDDTDTINDNQSRLGVVDLNGAQRNKRMEFFYAVQAKRHPRRHISEEELRAITTFLISNAQPFARANLTHKGIRKLLNRCPVLTVEASGAQGLAQPVDPLFIKGQPADRCCLVLSGQLRITCSDDNLESESGPWSTLALQALTSDNYVPDYCAEVITTARLLFISREEYRVMLRQASDESARSTDAKWVDVDRIQSTQAAGLGGRAFDWDASSQRNSGAADVVESAMLSRPPRRAVDDLAAELAASVPFLPFLPQLTRSHSQPEVGFDGAEADLDDQMPLCEMLGDHGSEGTFVPGPRRLSSYGSSEGSNFVPGPRRLSSSRRLSSGN